jgi:hypothetical protein
MTTIQGDNVVSEIQAPETPPLFDPHLTFYGYWHESILLYSKPPPPDFHFCHELLKDKIRIMALSPDNTMIFFQDYPSLWKKMAEWFTTINPGGFWKIEKISLVPLVVLPTNKVRRKKTTFIKKKKELNYTSL